MTKLKGGSYRQHKQKKYNMEEIDEVYIAEI